MGDYVHGNKTRSRPALNLNGGSVVTVEATHSVSFYEDAGATCSDEKDGELPVETFGVECINASQLGLQLITYNCTNTANKTTSKQRSVFVMDTRCPTCVVHDGTLLTVEASFPFDDPGALCVDSFSSVTLNVSGELDVEHVGTYRITYGAVDASGNT